jgi:hypothetical protein
VSLDVPKLRKQVSEKAKASTALGFSALCAEALVQMLNYQNTYLEWVLGACIPIFLGYGAWNWFGKTEQISRSIDEMPDETLVDQTRKLAGQMRKFDVNYHHGIRSSGFNSWAGSVSSGEMSEEEGRRRFLANTHRLNQLSDQYSEQLLLRYRPDAVLFRNQIKKRLGMLQEKPPIEIVASFDHAQAVNSAAVRAADYLDDLARRLDKS